MDRNAFKIRIASIDSIVALRKESVDRNTTLRCSLVSAFTVALRKESVDRNFVALKGREKPCRRSPQGERG